MELYGRFVLALGRPGSVARSGKMVALGTKELFPRHSLSTSSQTRRKGFLQWCKGGGGGGGAVPVAVPVDCPPALLPPAFLETYPSPLPEPPVPPEPAPMTTPATRTPQVVVIGAGAAGLSAASYLIDAGVNEVTVLEARDRPGGRIFSTVLGDAVVEVGTDLVYPDFSSLVQHMAAADGFIEGMPTWDPARTLFVHADGSAIDAPIGMLAYYRYRQMETDISERFHQSPEQSIHGDFAQLMGQVMSSELRRFPVEHRNTAARIMTGLAAARRRRSTTDPRFICKDSQGASLQLPGGPSIPLGLRGILSGALRRIGPDRIRYNKIVNKIRWGVLASGEPQVTVCCDDGETIVADYAIVTLPLGVLKEEHATLFCPSLPADKIDALDCLDLFHVTKIYLEYDSPFWQWRDDPIVIRFPSENASSSKSQSAWLGGVSRVSELPGSNHVLTAVVLGEHAVVAESLIDADIVEIMTKAMRKVSGDQGIPYPKDIIVSRWRSDRFTAGTGTAHSSEFARALCSTLADPVPGSSSGISPVLFFAGEHTSPRYGTLPGAALSGLREAESILELVADKEAATSCVIREQSVC